MKKLLILLLLIPSLSWGMKGMGPISSDERDMNKCSNRQEFIKILKNVYGPSKTNKEIDEMANSIPLSFAGC